MSEEISKNARILIVDDEPTNIKLLDSVLRSQGYLNLVKITDSRNVLNEYSLDRPDLILLDINMPHLDGYQVMEQLNSLDDPLLPPILILTAQSGHEYLLKALAMGARDLVRKPFDLTELLMRVRNLLDVQLGRRMLINQKLVLEEMVLKRTEELSETRLQVVRRLGRAAEYRDNETGFHIIRMSQISALLSKSLGLSDGYCELILHASPMHDIGKIGIPDAILLKPGKFELQEWEIMKTHVSIGSEILKDGNSDLLILASEIALNHHEKWDGTGYPSGLAGTSIPLSGRIVAVADVFDALTSPRPYKKAWSIGASVNYISENAGVHFDPEVVEHFKKCLPEILKIRDNYLEV